MGKRFLFGLLVLIFSLTGCGQAVRVIYVRQPPVIVEAEPTLPTEDAPPQETAAEPVQPPVRGYAEAYQQLLELAYLGDCYFDLFFLDDDPVPELAVAVCREQDLVRTMDAAFFCYDPADGYPHCFARSSGPANGEYYYQPGQGLLAVIGHNLSNTTSSYRFFDFHGGCAATVATAEADRTGFAVNGRPTDMDGFLQLMAKHTGNPDGSFFGYTAITFSNRAAVTHVADVR